MIESLLMGGASGMVIDRVQRLSLTKPAGDYTVEYIALPVAVDPEKTFVLIDVGYKLTVMARLWGTGNVRLDYSQSTTTSVDSFDGQLTVQVVTAKSGIIVQSVQYQPEFGDGGIVPLNAPVDPEKTMIFHSLHKHTGSGDFIPRIDIQLPDPNTIQVAPAQSTQYAHNFQVVEFA